jgi:hypothetical protein
MESFILPFMALSAVDMFRDSSLVLGRGSIRVILFPGNRSFMTSEAGYLTPSVTFGLKLG